MCDNIVDIKIQRKYLSATESETRGKKNKPSHIAVTANRKSSQREWIDG